MWASKIIWWMNGFQCDSGLWFLLYSCLRSPSVYRYHIKRMGCLLGWGCKIENTHALLSCVKPLGCVLGRFEPSDLQAAGQQTMTSSGASILSVASRLSRGIGFTGETVSNGSALNPPTRRPWHNIQTNQIGLQPGPYWTPTLNEVMTLFMSCPAPWHFVDCSGSYSAWWPAAVPCCPM